MKLKKKPYILIVGSGVLGAYLSKLLLKKTIILLSPQEKQEKQEKISLTMKN